MLAVLRSVTGLSGASAVEILKYLTTTVGGKISAYIVTLLSLLYLITPEIGNTHVQAFLGRLQVACIAWLVVVMFYRSAQNSKLLRQTIAIQTVNSALPNVSPDPGVQREIRSIEQTGTTTKV